MFSAIFIRRPRFALVISLFLMLAGIISVYRLPIAEYPQVSPPTIMVMATYPGASAQVIADTVASPLESEVNGTEDMVYYSSQSDNLGNYTLTLTFKSGADEDMALVNVNNAVKRAEHALPTDVVNNGITVVKRSSDMLATFAFYSENPEEFIAQALKPSDVVKVEIPDPAVKSCTVLVPDNQLSLAIGNKGQNAKLAAKLTGYKIDINPASYKEEED